MTGGHVLAFNTVYGCGRGVAAAGGIRLQNATGEIRDNVAAANVGSAIKTDTAPTVVHHNAVSGSVTRFDAKSGAEPYLWANVVTDPLLGDPARRTSRCSRSPRARARPARRSMRARATRASATSRGPRAATASRTPGAPTSAGTPPRKRRSAPVAGADAVGHAGAEGGIGPDVPRRSVRRRRTQRARRAVAGLAVEDHRARDPVRGSRRRHRPRARDLRGGGGDHARRTHVARWRRTG